MVFYVLQPSYHLFSMNGNLHNVQPCTKHIFVLSTRMVFITIRTRIFKTINGICYHFFIVTKLFFSEYCRTKIYVHVRHNYLKCVYRTLLVIFIAKLKTIWIIHTFLNRYRSLDSAIIINVFDTPFPRQRL